MSSPPTRIPIKSNTSTSNKRETSKNDPRLFKFINGLWEYTNCMDKINAKKRVPTFLLERGIREVRVIIKYIIFNIFDHMLGEAQQTFFTVKDISAREFIEAFAQYLKKNNLIERPAWADFVKTATRSELAPLDDDWIYYRVASLARKIYLRPRAGVRLLSHLYGGLKRGGCASEHHDHASTKIIRWGLQQLEKQKYIKKDKKGDGLKINARIISDEGRRTLNRIATEHIKNRK